MFGKHIGNELFSLAFFPVRDIQIDCSALCASALLNFLINRPRDLVASRKLQALWLVTFHETFPELVSEDATVASDLFCDECPALLWRVCHACWMKLDHFHIHKLCAHVQRPGI